MADIDIDASIRIVRGMCEGGNGVFHDACLAVCAEIERLRGERDAWKRAAEAYEAGYDGDRQIDRARQEARRG